jgi:hypothetical protein
MASRLEVDGSYADTWAGELGRRLVAALLGLAFMGALVVSFLATDGSAVPERSGAAGVVDASGAGSVGGPLGVVPLETGALVTALERVLGVAATDDAMALEDAWLTLAVVYDRMEAQASVAEGKRLPLMGAPPPAPARASREEGLVRSAMTYARGAIETRDLRALERARELLEMARR